MDCEFLKKCCETLTDENRRLQKELQELKALKLAQPLYMHMPAATLTMCAAGALLKSHAGERRCCSAPMQAAASRPRFVTPRQKGSGPPLERAQQLQPNAKWPPTGTGPGNPTNSLQNPGSAPPWHTPPRPGRRTCHAPLVAALASPGSPSSLQTPPAHASPSVVPG